MDMLASDVVTFLGAFGGAQYDSAAWIASLCLTGVIFVFLDIVLFRISKRKPVYIFFVIGEMIVLVASCFEGMELLVLATLSALIVGGVATLFANVSEYRSVLSKTMKGKTPLIHHNRKPAPEVLIDRDAVYEKVFRAVCDMSRLKRGALITFVKNDDILAADKLGTVIKQRGVDIDAPVSAELLETIFYEGTRLHDGAVVIKGDRIVRAAVFFQSTERPLTGKYGSRHQAAIGIAENSDSVTVVVSEETGRISIAYHGELTPVSQENFLRVFEEDMEFDQVEDGSSDIDGPVHQE